MRVMEKLFTIFGKIALVVLVLGSLTYGGYYYGIKTTKDTKPEAASVEVEIDNQDPQETTAPEIKLTAVIGGLSKSAGLSFDQYSLMVPEGWISSKESQTLMDEKLTLKKNGYEINIFQAATGGAVCLYAGDAEFEGPSSKYQTFVNLTTQDGKNLRRSGDLNGNNFTICQKSVDNSYQQPTNYGHISITMPVNFTAEILAEIDSILSSLKKI